MTTFDKRERAFEDRFAHDEEMHFKAVARRNRKLGLWAAEFLGKAGEAAEAYAMEIIRTDFEAPGHEEVVARLRADIGDRVPEAAIRQRMDELLLVAKDEILNEAR